MTTSAKAGLVVFSHGKESGPWGTKITHLAQIARGQGWAAESIDYQGMAEPADRIRLLLGRQPAGRPLLLVGSSMGGYVSAMACASLACDGLFLMAPALYLPGYPGEPSACPPDIEVIHGWDDDIVPLSSSFRFAERHRARLHVVADGHRLSDSADTLGAIFKAQLLRLQP